MKATISDNGEPLGIFHLEEKEFRTGSRGYYANGKLAYNGKRYQVNLMLVEIGSKNRR